MSIVEIPTSSDNAEFEEIIRLDGINYLLRFYWNTRDQRWYMDVGLPGQIAIVGGLKLVVNYDFAYPYAQDNFPQGMFLLYDDSNSEEPCLRNDLGNRCVLLYYSVDEFS